MFVFSDQFPTAGKLAAKAIRVARRPALEGRQRVIGGLVTAAEIRGANNPTFADKVQMQSIDASGATFTNGDANDLANGRLVRIDGTLSGGKVLATNVGFLR